MNKYKVRFMWQKRWYELEISSDSGFHVRQLVEQQYPGAQAITVKEVPKRS